MTVPLPQYTEYHSTVDDKGPDAPPDPAPARSRLATDAKRLAEDRVAAAQTIASVGTLGLSFVFALAIGTALGLWLDRVTGWSPWFFFTFFLLGLAAGVLNVYRTFKNLPK